MTREQVLGIIYTFCFSICYLPQILKSLSTKNVEDVSVQMFVLSIIGYISAMGYTLLRVGWDFWWIINYLFGLVSSSIMVCIYYKYKKK